MTGSRHLFSRWGTVLACIVFAVASVSPVAAQQTGEATQSIALDRFEPSPVQRTSIGAVETSDVLPHGVPAIGWRLVGTDDPLEAVERRDGERRTLRLVDERYESRLEVGLGLFDRWSVGLSLPLVHQTGVALLDRRGRTGPLAPWAFGDLQIAAKWQIVRGTGPGSFGVATSLQLFAPVGDAESYNSAGVFRAEPRVAVDWRPAEGWEFALNAGWEFRPRRVVADRVVDDRLTVGLGGRLPVGIWRLRALGHVVGELPVAPTGDGEPTAVPYLEALGGLGARVTDRVRLQLLAGSGLTSALGSPDVRVTAGVEYAPVALDADDDTVADRRDGCPDQQEDMDGFRDDDGCPDPDNDGDGIPDGSDDCPDDPEDPDQFEDEDGCPDPDNDGDGVSDATDACPDESGKAWKSGCPFVDSDGDGIDDTRDANPNAAEDEDGYQDDDGAPDPDNDGDGLPDAEDDCPDEAEVVNGVDDGDGCPDEGESGVVVSEEDIEVDERVYFDTDRATIKQRSYSILEEVAAALKANPEIEKVRIEGHTDGKGDDLYNLALSQRRANAVREFLIERGVESERLESRGYGESEPIASNDDEEGRRKNRRVEITILEVRDAEDASDSGAEE